MSFLHDELAKFKAAAGEAFNFADPEAYVKQELDKFHATIADEFEKLEARVKALEPQPAAAPAPAVAEPVSAGLEAAAAAIAAPAAPTA
jgi:hypothetical protein